MRRAIAQLIGLVAVMSVTALWLFAVPFVSAGDPCYHGFEIPASSTASGNEIKLHPCAFTPTVTRVAAGTTVTFVNGPDFVHLITGANQAWGSRDAEVQPNTSVAYTFDKAGLYPYACALHRGMSGVIVVGDVASTGSAGSGTGAVTGSGTTSSAATTTQPDAATATAPTDGLGLVAIGVVGGLIIGALVVWVAMRRRAVRREEPVAGVA